MLGVGLVGDLDHRSSAPSSRASPGTSIGTCAADGLAGRCFLYHLIGNGTGQWRVPVGGMGAVSGAMAMAARGNGAELVTRATVTALDPRADGVSVTWTDDEGRELQRSAAPGC